MLSRIVFLLQAGEVAISNPLPFYLASIWDERRGLIIAVLAIVAVQSALIAGLLVYHAALRRAKREGQEAHLEMRRMQDEIAHVGRVSMMGQLASSLAHEINQPLGAILRNAEAAELFLENKNPDLEEIRSILADIRADDQRAGSVIDRMRSLLKRHVLDTQPLDLGELVGDVAQLARTDAATRRVKLTVEVAEDLPPVRGDRVHLQQVLLNLIVNGMDALNGSSPENRRVTVSAHLNGAQTMEVAVSDSGHGIAPEKIAHVFDAFYTTKADGMGMGLPISRTIVESHGGRLWVENNDSSGATFRFTLPLAEGQRGEGRGARGRV
jgi:C4-dicarboxylate-specific signal transduction histidine kinase